MMPRVITLKSRATCADCGARLEVGASARYYGRNRIYGLACHDVDWRQVRQDRARVGVLAYALLHELRAAGYVSDLADELQEAFEVDGRAMPPTDADLPF
jgi:hypothetical protein